jgi:hypothetical protein
VALLFGHEIEGNELPVPSMRALYPLNLGVQLFEALDSIIARDEPSGTTALRPRKMESVQGPHSPSFEFPRALTPA